MDLFETNFRAQKQYFKLDTENYACDYNNLIASMTTAFIRYIMLDLCQRYHEDIRSLGKLFRNTCEQLEDIPYISAIDSLMSCFTNLAKDLAKAKLLKFLCLDKAEQLINEKLSSWFTCICQYLQRLFDTLRIS